MEPPLFGNFPHIIPFFVSDSAPFPYFPPKENIFNPIGCGGGGIRPPYHTFVIPRKKLMGKVANFFLLFLNM